MGVVLVDPWMTLDAETRGILQALDRRNKPWVGVLVPWNELDEQLRGAEAELRLGLRESFPTTALDAINGVSGLTRFSFVLRQVIQALCTPYLREVQSFPPLVPGTRRPRLWSPSFRRACQTQGRHDDRRPRRPDHHVLLVQGWGRPHDDAGQHGMDPRGER
ncbi:FxsC protein [Acrocarpospora catenulata]|uniref:FxsC protein n=1 Tax=Acrocarpospora catenulata TaxID=2836182 RepID=UPI0035572498